MAEESTSAATAPWPFTGLKTKVTFCAAGAGITARELSAGVELVWAPVDVWVPLAAAADALGTIAEADDAPVGLELSAEGEEDDEDGEGESATCAAAGVSVFPSSWPLTHVGRITPFSLLYRNVWLPAWAVRPGEV